ncbi:MAG: DinB family protein [Acidobacteria bacterium]|nr:DinB family protein [Acidobacteriota bacterium]
MRTTLLLMASLAVAPLPLHAQDTLKTTNIQRYYTPVRLFLQGAAEAMPADKYGFKLDPEQMTFGQWINHSTERNYVDCATLRGEPNPMPKAKTDLLTAKADIVKALGESFQYCDAAFTTLDDRKILASPQMVAAFLHTTVHNNEIYGNVVGYLRANHIVPPSTEMIQEMIKAKKTPQQMMQEMMDKYNRKPPAR